MDGGYFQMQHTRLKSSLEQEEGSLEWDVVRSCSKATILAYFHLTPY
jgi:hypothetical protein